MFEGVFLNSKTIAGYLEKIINILKHCTFAFSKFIL